LNKNLFFKSIFSKTAQKKGETEGLAGKKWLKLHTVDWKGLEELAFSAKADFSGLLSLSQRLLQAPKSQTKQLTPR